MGSLKQKPALYIPPEGISFRLAGFASSCVLFSRHHESPSFGHFPLGEIYADQWWQLVPGSGEHEGRYLIKSDRTKEVIWSRTNMKPYVGTIDVSGGSYSDNWFVLEPGTGKLTNYFRLVCPYSNTVLFSRTHMSPEVGNFHADGDKYDDQYFHFLFEDMDVESIHFDVDKGEIVNSVPLVIARQRLVNDTSVPQSLSSTFTKSEQRESSFEYTRGFAVTVGLEFSAGIPIVADGKISVSTTVSSEFKWGTTTTTTESFSDTFNVTAPANSSVIASATVHRYELSVPYTMTLKSRATEYEIKTEGVYHGVSFHDLVCHYSEPEDKNKK
ncbi:natterin-like protein [Diplodia corticola]|uniref:Natterin-like protein n=1 Tax=Diplodia corticola TaxID=236234 RepID=A0A1J9RGK2_9PEZI|nr:natterin-like protein [Diplodia corticola]OJD40670.1 natterin-like protein [Diplodia corticola]